MPFPKITEMGHALLPFFISQGDTVVDATCGNGKDTLYLARLAGPKGKVYAFDIQETALRKTRERLEKERDPIASVHYILDDHRNIDAHVKETPAAILFNLGYLPGGDHRITTQTSSTLIAVEKSLTLLKQGGLLLITSYPGHEEGKKEAAALARYFSSLSRDNFRILKIGFLENHENSQAPYILAVEKRS
ncbi:class I SAM-dependent methyltransferase [Thermicanus aegyptius]|uniref:class I SAM-dependent methyltransferase n=1 Tax=Thermicanus aegyptius TaxID=94009 RepID=UPI0004126189|nr:class I SAM-dependent methyltransferase [Thermicanus aegyptius]